MCLLGLVQRAFDVRARGDELGGRLQVSEICRAASVHRTESIHPNPSRQWRFRCNRVLLAAKSPYSSHSVR